MFLLLFAFNMSYTIIYIALKITTLYNWTSLAIMLINVSLALI